MTEGIVGRIVDAARREHLDPVAEDVADVLWLAREISAAAGGPAPDTGREPRVPDRSGDRPPPSDGPGPDDTDRATTTAIGCW